MNLSNKNNTSNNYINNHNDSDQNKQKYEEIFK